jgi:hypothetical protein
MKRIAIAAILVTLSSYPIVHSAKTYEYKFPVGHSNMYGRRSKSH